MESVTNVASWLSDYYVPLVFAIVATLGYVLGRRSNARVAATTAQSKRELRKALTVAREMEKIAVMVRRNLAQHYTSVAKFKQRVAMLTDQREEAAWQKLCQEAEDILSPTLRLATQMANAYDQIRQQTNHLMAFTEVRTDALTGVGNRRGLDDAIASHFAMLTRYGQIFSIVLFDLDNFKQINDERGHLQGDQMLQRVGRALDECARETDVVARYGGEEFAVVMPQTDLEGACVFSERMRARIEKELPITASGGITSAIDGDTPDSLMARADAALYAAKEAGRNRILRHNGREIEPIIEDVPAAVVAQ